MFASGECDPAVFSVAVTQPSEVRIVSGSRVDFGIEIKMVLVVPGV